MHALYQSLPLVYLFRVVVEKGSFQGAARALGLPRSSVSKKIQQLEQALQQPLLVRSTRKLMLTDLGQALFDGSTGMVSLLQQVERLADSSQHSPTGRVRLSSGSLLGQAYLLPLLAELRQRYPDITLEISFKDEKVDFYEEETDIALRVGALPDSSLIARKVGEKIAGWFAAPDYLALRGVPQTPDELLSHDCLVYRNRTFTNGNWLFEDRHGLTTTLTITPAMYTDHSRALVDMAVAGLGIIMTDRLAIQSELKQGRLVRILEEWHHPNVVPVHLVSLGKNQRSRAAECVWRYLVERLAIKSNEPLC